MNEQFKKQGNSLTVIERRNNGKRGWVRSGIRPASSRNIVRSIRRGIFERVEESTRFSGKKVTFDRKA